MPEISIVIPAYNEQDRLPGTITKLKDLMTGIGRSAEVIVVVEKSQDKTLTTARRAIDDDPRFILIDNKVHRGKGYAVRSGVLKARGKFIFFMDADFSTDGSAFGEFLDYFDQHQEVDILIGSREHANSRIVSAQNYLRRSMGRTFNLLVRTFIFSGFKDTQCGFKAFRRQAAVNAFKAQTIDSFAFDVEILMLAQKMNYKIVDLPIVWTNSEDSRVEMLSGSLKMLSDLLSIKRKLRSFSPAIGKTEVLEITDV